MYNDFRSPAREQWKYCYTGKDLAAAAKAKYETYTKAELEDREVLAGLLKDPNVRANDKRIDDLKTAIEFNSSEREKCRVWWWEFERQPDEKYMLSLADVVYFNLTSIPVSS